MNSIVLPGDVVEVGGGALGPGLWSGEGEEVQASVAGIVRGEPGKKTWVDHSKKRVSWILLFTMMVHPLSCTGCVAVRTFEG